MEPNQHTEPPDLRYILPRDAFYHLTDDLRTSLPPPPCDTPDAFVRRDNDAIAQVSALLPVNAAEAALAGQHVIMHAQSMDSMRLSRDPTLSFKQARQCHAQSVSMARQSLGALHMLLRLQAERRAIEADPAKLEKAAWAEHCAVGLMARALPGAPSPLLAEPPQPEPQPPEPEPAQDDEPTPDPVAEADEYTVIYPDRARLIRRAGCLPPDVRFGPPEDYLVRALVTGRTPTLLALDAEPERHNAPA